jgi:hypothetical protein
MNFRFILQPVMASIFAIIAGLKDAKAGKPPYFWSLLTGRARRLDRIRDGWKSVGKLIVVALSKILTVGPHMAESGTGATVCGGFDVGSVTD